MKTSSYRLTIACLALVGAVAGALAGITVESFGSKDRAQAAGPFIVYVSPNPIGGNPFLELGKKGLEAAGKTYGAETAVYESTTAASRRENVEAAVNEGADLIILLGFEFNDIVAELAATEPDTQFLIVDQCIESPPANVHCAVFREYEASYLMGVAAALMTKANHIGVVGALDIPFMHRYTDGYAKGAEATKPGIKVDVRWVGGSNPFSDPVRAKEQALAIHGAGADIVFAATSGGDFGVFEAARESEFLVLAVDVNRCPEVPGHMIDVTLKRVDNAVIQLVGEVLSGTKSAFLALGLEEGGVGAIALDQGGLSQSQCLIANESGVRSEMQEVAREIISGALVIEDPMFAQ